MQDDDNNEEDKQPISRFEESFWDTMPVVLGTIAFMVLVAVVLEYIRG